MATFNKFNSFAENRVRAAFEQHVGLTRKLGTLNPNDPIQLRINK